MAETPVLYSFRRCPYAMRARMALISAEISLEHREILLRNKPPKMLEKSPKGTVPVLILDNVTVLEQSWDIMLWALDQQDPQSLLGTNRRFLDPTVSLVETLDGTFKTALDHYKYADRHPLPVEQYRQQGWNFLQRLNSQLSGQRNLLANQLSIADLATMPFVRQFAHVDRPWFLACGLDNLIQWLDRMIESDLFKQAMIKHPLWDFSSPENNGIKIA